MLFINIYLPRHNPSILNRVGGDFPRNVFQLII